MSQITSGKVLYGRTVQPAQYESKRVDVEIAFVVGEGEDYQGMLAIAANAAYGKCHEMLGIKTPALAAPAADTRNDARPKESISGGAVVVETAGPTDAKAKGAGKTRKAPPAADPAAVDVVGEAPAAAASSAPATATAPAAQAGSDPAAVEDWSAAPAEVTDEALMQAITKKNADIKNPAAIRALIGKYVAPPKQAREIEQAKRSAFLAELDALKKAA